MARSFMKAESITRTSAGIVLFLGSALVQADDSNRHLDRNVDLRCQQQQQQLSCDLRFLKHDLAGIIPKLVIEGNELAAPVVEKLSETTAPHSAIMFLVDSSDPRRAATVQLVAEQVRAMTATADPGTLLGLAAFDKGLQLLQATTANHAEVIAASEKLLAKGKVTELYRSTGEAIELLRDVPVPRKAIYIFSDGLAEDTAYDLDSTIASARDHNITIYGFGYARTASAAVGLQTLRRLSEETGGSFIEAANDASLSQQVLQQAAGYVTAGNIISWDLAEIISTPGDKDTAASIGLQAGGRTISLALDLHLQDRVEPLPEPEPEPPPPPPVVITVPAIDEEVAEVQQKNYLAIFILAASVLLLVLVLVLYTMRSMKKDSAAPQVVAAADNSTKPVYAYVRPADAPQDSDESAIPINNNPWRVGRGSNNDHVINDSSVSRNHAEISYLGANKFRLVDLGSSNGVLVNGEKIEGAEIKDGDLIELGDIKLVFTMHQYDDASEATEFVHTRMSDS